MPLLIQGTGRQRGSGFVHFSNDEAGRAAVLAASRDLQRSERLGVVVSAEVSNTFRQYMEQQRRKEVEASSQRISYQSDRQLVHSDSVQPIQQVGIPNSSALLTTPIYTLQPPYDPRALPSVSIVAQHRAGQVIIPNNSFHYERTYPTAMGLPNASQFVYYQQDMIYFPIASQPEGCAYSSVILPLHTAFCTDR
jgi:RNA recognition motif-containing protein